MKHIIFDFDGTLFDSAEGIFQSFVVAARSIQLSPPTRSHFIPAIGPPIQKLIPLIYNNLPHDKFLAMCAAFRRHYDSIGYLNSSTYEGIFELLRALDADHDIDNLSIVTNKPTLPTIKLLVKNKLHKYFDDVIGIDYPHFWGQGTSYASKSEALKELLQSYSNSHVTPIYIGDTAADLQAACSAGCLFIGVSYGFSCWQQSHSASHQIAESPDQLLAFIAAI